MILMRSHPSAEPITKVARIFNGMNLLHICFYFKQELIERQLTNKLN